MSKPFWKLFSASQPSGLDPDGMARFCLAFATLGGVERFGEFGGGGIFDFAWELYGVAGRVRVLVYALAAAGAFELGRQDYDFVDCGKLSRGRS
jgi:hypothetical protein